MSQKAQYAGRAVLELAKHHGTGPLKSTEIAVAQHIPQRFLNNILLQLRFAGIVESVRGQRGGYNLSRPARRVSMGDVLRAVERSDHSQDRAKSDVRPDAPGWTLVRLSERAHRAMMEVYDSTTFEDLLEEEAAESPAGGLDYAI